MKDRKTSVPAAKTRLKQEVEIFQELYYDTLVKPNVIVASAAQKALGQKVSIKLIKDETKLAWDSASDEVRHAVTEERTARKKRKDAQKSAASDTSSIVERTVDEIQQYVIVIVTAI
jgi:predicted oxidoreductase (fatty acid repression mutant protein)